MTGELLDALVGPVVAGLVAGTGVIIRHWVQRRDREHRGRQGLALARDQVTFIDAYVAARARLLSDDERAAVRRETEDDLRAALHLARRAWDLASRERESFDARMALRSLLLVGRARTWPARATRLLYLCSLGWLVLATAAGTDIALSEGLTPGNVATWLVFILLFGLAPVWLLRAATLRLVARSPSPVAAAGGPTHLGPEHGPEAAASQTAARGADADLIDIRDADQVGHSRPPDEWMGPR